MNNLIVGDLKYMSSVEIATLTRKRHGDILRDIRSMLKNIDDADLHHEQYQEHIDSRGYTSEILLDKELSITLVSGYSAKIRNAIIRRWIELEKQASMLSNMNNDSKDKLIERQCLILDKQLEGYFTPLSG